MTNDINENSFLNGAIGVGAGWASYKYLPSIIKRPYGRYLLTEFKDIPESVQKEYWEAGKRAFDSSGLAQKGVDIVDINKDNLENVIEDTFVKTEKFEKELDKKFGLKLRTKKSEPRPRWKYILFGPDNKSKIANAMETMSKGQNACYYNAANSVYVNKEKMGFSIFHEMGHAINANTTTARKILSYGRHTAAALVPTLLAIALIKKRKPESDSEPANIRRKKNFLKDNIGLISFACLLPTVAEEGLASINGAKMAKKVLNPDMYKKLNKTNAKAFGSYALAAALVGVCAQLAVYVKDKVFQPKQ